MSAVINGVKYAIVPKNNYYYNYDMLVKYYDWVTDEWCDFFYACNMMRTYSIQCEEEFLQHWKYFVKGEILKKLSPIIHKRLMNYHCDNKCMCFERFEDNFKQEIDTVTNIDELLSVISKPNTYFTINLKIYKTFTEIVTDTIEIVNTIPNP